MREAGNAGGSGPARVGQEGRNLSGHAVPKGRGGCLGSLPQGGGPPPGGPAGHTARRDAPER
eukprot:8505229-Alexandrium_andersonii.AAC.1